MSTRFDYIFDKLEQDAAGLVNKHSEDMFYRGAGYVNAAWNNRYHPDYDITIDDQELQSAAHDRIKEDAENVKEDLREAFRERYKEYVLENVSARNEVKDLVYVLALQFSIEAIEATQNSPEQFERIMEQLRAKLEEDIMEGIGKIL